MPRPPYREARPQALFVINSPLQHTCFSLSGKGVTRMGERRATLTKYRDHLNGIALTLTRFIDVVGSGLHEKTLPRQRLMNYSNAVSSFLDSFTDTKITSWFSKSHSVGKTLTLGSACTCHPKRRASHLGKRVLPPRGR